MREYYWNDYDFPNPNYWVQENGRIIKIKDMTDKHIFNCMKMIGIDNEWYKYFLYELKNRGYEEGYIIEYTEQNFNFK